MKRTIIAVAACGAALLAAACTPQDAPVNPAASSASGADATTAAESSRAAESTSECIYNYLYSNSSYYSYEISTIKARQSDH